MRCMDCPLMCKADRDGEGVGACGVGRTSYIARAARHFFEEPPISGTRGSGAIFFKGCNMRCVFCQNVDISRSGAAFNGQEEACDAERLVEIMLRLQALGAHNINLVTPSPHIRLIESAVPKARETGLDIPIVYNTSGYERAEVIKRLEGLIDIYLPDMKYVSPKLAQRYSGRENYFDFASQALREMFRQVGNLSTDDGIAEKGMLIRHLVLPCAVDETRRVLDFIADNFPPDINISLMSQYTPIPGMKKPLDRRLTKAEYDRAVDYAVAKGFENIFIQELSSAKNDYTPVFDGFVE